MMSRSSFCKLVLDEARRNIWALALSALGFLFAGPLSIVIYWQDYQSAAGWGEKISTAPAETELIEGLTEWLVVPLSRAGLIIMALLCGIVMFRFLHDRRQIDFYHALPIRREGLYAVKFTAGLLLVLPAYFVSRLLSVAVIAGLGYLGAINWGMLLAGILGDLCAFFTLYGIVILCVVLCGSTLVSVMLSLWALFSPYTVVMTHEFYAQSFYPAYSYSSAAKTLYCPVFAFLGFDSERTTLEIIFFAVHTLLGLAALVLSFLLFRRRKAERSGQAIAFYSLRLPLKIYSCLVMGLFTGCILRAIVGNEVGIFWLYLFTAVFTVACHCVMEAVYAGDARAFFQKRGTLLALTAASLLMCYGLKADVFGYSRWVPQENSIKWTVLESLSAEDVAGGRAINQEHSYYYYSYDDRTEMGMSDPSVIQAMCRLAEIGTDHLDLQSWGAQSRKERDEWNERRREAGSCYTIRLTFGMSAARSETREYTLPVTEESTALINEVLYSEQYLRNNHVVFLYEKGLEDDADRGRMPMITVSDLLEEEPQALHDQAQIKALLDAVSADVLDAAPEQAAPEGPVLRLYLGTYQDGDIRRRGDMMMIYPSYHRTLALIQEYTGLVPQPLRAEDFSSVMIGLRGEAFDRIGKGERVSSATGDFIEVTTKDPEQIARLIADLVCIDTGEVRANFGMWIKTDITVQLQSKNGMIGYAFAYPADRVPEDVIKELLAEEGPQEAAS